MRTPHRQSMRPSLTRQARWLLLATTSLFVLAQAEPAPAQSCTGSPCVIPAGSVTTPFNSTLVTSQPLIFTNNGSFTVAANGVDFPGAIQVITSGGDGKDSSSDTAGNGSPASTLSFTNNGTVSHIVPPVLQGPVTVVSVYGASAGGNGGNYTNSDAKHDAGEAAAGSTATMANAASITVSAALLSAQPSTMQTGAALLVQSLGGNGGNVQRQDDLDENNNPTYDGHNGHSGAAAGAASLTNAGAISVTLPQPQVALWYWGAAARSLGGAAGTGDQGRNGGAGNLASVTNSANVSVSMAWGPQLALPVAPPPPPPPPPGALGAFAVAAISQGGNATMSVKSGNNGGAGGAASNANLLVTGQSAPITITLNTTNPGNLASTPISAALAAISLGGAGGAGYNDSTGGTGGQGGTPSVQVDSGVTILATGDRTRGILALSQGGLGGGSGVGQNGGKAGPGGSTVVADPSANWISLNTTSIGTSGMASAGVMAASLGGNGGLGEDYNKDGLDESEGGTGGAAGSAGPVRVSMTNGSITTSGPSSPGLVALAQGGRGGNGGGASGGTGAGSGTGGSGGLAGAVTVTINGNATIGAHGATGSGDPGFGVYAASIGGAGGTGGSVSNDFASGRGNGGEGGSAGLVTINLAATGSVATQGDGAAAVFGRSQGGAGGNASPYSVSGLVSTDGNGGVGGNAGSVSITNAATLRTIGRVAHGIVAQSAGGPGGVGANGTGAFDGSGGSGGNSGTSGFVTIVNAGAITTAGYASLGILAQSMGASGGNGGAGDGSFYGPGGSAGAGSNGSQVTVTHSGRIATSGDFGLGILAQSVGGGGGNGGGSNTIFTSLGGSGGGGGLGGTVTVELLGGSITTGGRLAHGAVAQSIGGGGGNGGDANSTGVLVTLAIGGSAGAGGAGGEVTLYANRANIAATGSNAAGVLAQSIGGGGGAAGSGYSTTVGGDFAMSTAIGGKGGNGGAGGYVTVNLFDTTLSTGLGTAAGVNTNPVDAYGVHAQSIGGGGGVGGSASAQAIAIALPFPPSGPSIAASVSTAIGGAGGAAGNGGNLDFLLGGSSGTSSDTRITTQGQGSHAVLLQSVGGGGGAGGDSSAMATTIGYGRAASVAEGQEFSLNIGVSLGGAGSSGGRGGSVTARMDAFTITTYGDYANGLLIQSIGGGGGNGGIGSSTTANFGITNSATIALGLGGTGGTGGAGGDLDLTLNPQGVIQTYGASAIGLVGQSIGGGGGTSQGGTLHLGIGGEASASDADNAPTSRTANLTINLGTAGGSGGNGGNISAVMQGQIRTAGNDAAGVVLQSIGGGGGIAGSAGSDASADNPISTLTGLRGKITDKIEGNTNEGYTASLSLGGRGGGGGAGGGITYSMAGSLSTLGDWSHGLVTQSIGGGGGMGGAATSSSSGASYSATIAVGGSGGAGGAGGALNLTFGANSRINTGVAGGTGYAAFGVLAQSIGGGGGIAADGSVGSTGEHNIGGSGRNGSAGVQGAGGNITVNGTVNIVTRGDVGMGMLLQSIGGGGGVSGSGSSASAAPGGATQIQVGGTIGTSGNGGAINFGTFSNYVSLTIRTSGANAYGLLAQSIGGGGGFGFAPGTGTNSVGNTAGGLGNGSDVSLYLDGTGITTSGFGAHGIVAQSIGGGGGIAGLPAASAATVLNASSSGTGTGSGAGGNVTIISTAPITTTGAFAHGIVAQSISGGGGLYVRNGTEVVAGSTNQSPGAAATAGTIVIGPYAPVTASGANSTAIFAQAVGGSGQNVDGRGVQVKVDINTAISGGSGSGWGVYSVSSNTASFTNLASGASVSALSGNAIFMTAGSVNNGGTVTGNYNLANGTFYNYNILNGGPSLVASQLDNAGTVLIASHAAFGVSAVSGNFTQRASGRLLFDADFSNRRSDVMTVTGSADLAGRVRPLISSVLPNVEIPFLTVNGPVTGTLVGEPSTVFTYDVNRKGGGYAVSANADFTPAGYDLRRNGSAVAGHLQAAWDAGGAGLGPLFALLGNTADAGGEGAYRAALRQISPDSSLAPGARLAAGARAFANAAMSCPQFEGSTAMLTEGECVWAGLTGRTASQSANDGLSSFRLNSTTWQAGGQRRMGGGWFLGGSIAFENTRLTTPDGLNSGRGEAGFGAVTLKYQTGPWLFAGAVFGGGGQFTSNRTITLPGFGGVARGSPSLANAGAMLRGTYTIGREEFYLRPSLSLSLVHARSGAYRESGAGVLDLEVAAASSTVAAVTPALEIGGRQSFANGMVMRVFAAGGLSLLSDGRWNQESRLVSAATSAGRFSSVVRTDQVVGRVAVGAQLFTTDRLELRLQYEGEYSANLTGHGGSVALALRF
jgi:hypothetical protein